MRSKYDPFPLIFAQGDETTKLACLSFFGFGDSPQAKEYLLSLIKQQRSDGTFPSHLDPEKWGMQETVRTALLLLKVGMPPEGVNVGSAVTFILNHQEPDGGWCENRALKLPPERTWLSNERSITWLTADVVDLLGQAGLEGHSQYEAAVKWLRATQNQDGGWPSLARDNSDRQSTISDPDASVQIGFLLGDLYGDDDPAHLKGRAFFERHLDEYARDVERGYWIRLRDGKREELDGYTLTHLFLSWLLDPPRRFQSGYDVSDPRVRRMMEALVDMQREDGGWRPFWSEKSSPIYTVLSLKVLALSGMLAQKDLEDDVKSYAV
jgi:hypothetical protein